MPQPPLYVTKAFCLVTYVQLFYVIVAVKFWLTQCYLTLIRLVSMMHFNCKAMPTNDTNYSCHIKAVELV